MIRKGFLMQVKDGMIEEYEKTHNPIWPELQEALKKHGISNYTIFHDAKTNLMFGYAEIDNEADFKELANLEICHKWWKRMKKYLVSDSEDAPKAREDEMREVFHMD